MKSKDKINLLEIGMVILIFIFITKISSIVQLNSFIENSLIAVSLVLISTNIFHKKMSTKVIIINAIFIIFGLISYLNTGQSIVLELIIISLSIRRSDFIREISFMYKATLFFYVVHLVIFILLAISGKIDFFIDLYGRNRVSFGMIHPNLFSVYTFNLILMWSWLNYDRINIKSVVIIFAIFSILFIFTDTRTTYAIGIIFIIMMSILKKKQQSRGFELLSRYLFPSLLVIFGILTFYYTKNVSFINVLDKILSGRIHLSSYGLNHYGFSPFGQKIQKDIVWDSYWRLNSITFDNLYSYLAFNIGYFWIFALILLTHAVKKQNPKNYLYIMLFSIYSVTEVHTINCFYFFPVLLFSVIDKERIKLSMETRK